MHTKEQAEEQYYLLSIEGLYKYTITNLAY
jgi:hypothetical protein